MPPKKKARQPSRGVSTPSTDPTEPVAETLCPVKLQPIPDDPLQNLWTNEQETLLFRSMIRWKPVGPSFSACLSKIRRKDQWLIYKIRDAQALPNDRHIGDYEKSWLYLASRLPYPNTWHLGQIGQTL